jgi:hypothetical protein
LRPTVGMTFDGSRPVWEGERERAARVWRGPR